MSAVRVGRRVELTVTAADDAAARAIVERLAARAPVEPADRGVRDRGRSGRRRRSSPAAVAGAGDERPDRGRRLPGLEPRHRCGQRPRGRGRGAGDPVARGRRRSTASPAILLPGGFAYGDYLRAGVIARFSPVMRAVAGFAARGRPRPRDLQRLPGPDRGPSAARARCSATAACGSCRARSRSPPSGSTRRSPTLLGERRPLRMPVAHGEGALLRRRRDARRARGERPGPVPLRPRRRRRGRAARRTGRTRTARSGRSPAS